MSRQRHVSPHTPDPQGQPQDLLKVCKWAGTAGSGKGLVRASGLSSGPDSASRARGFPLDLSPLVCFSVSPRAEPGTQSTRFLLSAPGPQPHSRAPVCSLGVFFTPCQRHLHSHHTYDLLGLSRTRWRMEVVCSLRPFSVPTQPVLQSVQAFVV